MRRLDRYTAVIRRAYPALAVDSVKAIEDGQYNDVLVVNNDLIFRFPRYADAIETMRHEVRVLRAIAGRTTLPVPDPIDGELTSNAVGEVFMGYRRLPGEPLRRDWLATLDGPATRRLAGQLARFLRTLHDTPIAAVADLPVQETPAEWRGLHEKFRVHLFPHMRPDARRDVQATFEAFLPAGDTPVFTQAIRHGDFGDGNILVDARGAASGVIDFGFAGLGDPALDLAATMTLGDAFFAALQAAYEPDAAQLARARFYRTTFALYEAWHGAAHGDRAAFERGIAAYR